MVGEPVSKMNLRVWSSMVAVTKSLFIRISSGTLVIGAERSKTRDLGGVDSRMGGFFAQAANYELHIKKKMVI